MTAGTVVLVAVVAVTGLAIAVAGGWPLTSAVLRLAVGPAGQEGEAPVLRGGTWIGVLERLAIAGTIMLGHPEGIAVVTAVKGLGRFPELRAAAGASASERFIIGTLTSFCWAGAVGAAARAALVALG